MRYSGHIGNHRESPVRFINWIGVMIWLSLTKMTMYIGIILWWILAITPYAIHEIAIYTLNKYITSEGIKFLVI